MYTCSVVSDCLQLYDSLAQFSKQKCRMPSEIGIADKQQIIFSVCMSYAMFGTYTETVFAIYLKFKSC